MTPMFFVVAILGCGDGGSQCTEARVAPAHYETLAQCRAALPGQITANTDIPYPVIGADCRARGGMRMADAGAKGPRG